MVLLNMVDPITAITAIGLADNVLSFLTLALKLSCEAYSSIDGLPKEPRDISVVTERLRTTSQNLQNGLAELERSKDGALAEVTKI